MQFNGQVGWIQDGEKKLSQNNDSQCVSASSVTHSVFFKHESVSVALKTTTGAPTD